MNLRFCTSHVPNAHARLCTCVLWAHSADGVTGKHLLVITCNRCVLYMQSFKWCNQYIGNTEVLMYTHTHTRGCRLLLTFRCCHVSFYLRPFHFLCLGCQELTANMRSLNINNEGDLQTAHRSWWVFVGREVKRKYNMPKSWHTQISPNLSIIYLRSYNPGVSNIWLTDQNRPTRGFNSARLMKFENVGSKVKWKLISLSWHT